MLHLFRKSRLGRSLSSTEEPQKPEVMGSYHAIPGMKVLKGSENAPNVDYERYNYDRMAIFLRNFDFRNKTILDVGCNAGWFCQELAIAGAKKVIGLDFNGHKEMGGALELAAWRSRRDNLPIRYVDIQIDGRDLNPLDDSLETEAIDYALVLSVAHHINSPEKLFSYLANRVSQGIIYEHHEFWNELQDDHGNKLGLIGEGHRYGWNENLDWLDAMGSINSHRASVEEFFRTSKWSSMLGITNFRTVKFLGFSEKRRPIIALLK